MVTKSYATAALGDSPIEEDVAKYTAAAFALKQVLDQMGPIKWDIYKKILKIIKIILSGFPAID